MASYQGPATLIVDVQQLDLKLSAKSTTNPAGLVSWEGLMRAPRVPTVFLNAGSGTLRVGDEEAACNITAEVRYASGRSTVTLRLTGSGSEPPF